MTEAEFEKAVRDIQPKPDGTGWSCFMQFAELCMRRQEHEQAEKARSVKPSADRQAT